MLIPNVFTIVFLGAQGADVTIVTLELIFPSKFRVDLITIRDVNANAIEEDLNTLHQLKES